MGQPKRTPITQAQFDLITTGGGWCIDEVPQEYWKHIPGLQRLQDTIAIMASGTASEPKVLNGIRSYAGLDVLTHEPDPHPGEPEGNAYHYVFQQVPDPRYPYIMHGPFRSETAVPHWFDADNLSVYWRT